MKTFLIICLLLLTVIVATGGNQQPQKAWEYKTEDRCFDEKRINALGAEGWDMAGFSETDRGAWHCVFKRQK